MRSRFDEFERTWAKNEDVPSKHLHIGTFLSIVVYVFSASMFMVGTGKVGDPLELLNMKRWQRTSCIIDVNYKNLVVFPI